MRNYRGWGRWASLVTQLVKNLPTVQSDRVLTSGQGDPLEKGMATHSSILPENSIDRGAWWSTVHWIAESHTTDRLALSLFRAAGN